MIRVVVNQLKNSYAFADKVHGSFADVRVPQTTIDTLQSLITLPLVRPDVFRKGILKDNFISGVLLFGPPGTGKVLFINMNHALL